MVTCSRWSATLKFQQALKQRRARTTHAGPDDNMYTLMQRPVCGRAASVSRHADQTIDDFATYPFAGLARPGADDGLHGTGVVRGSQLRTEELRLQHQFKSAVSVFDYVLDARQPRRAVRDRRVHGA
jgi:hypothetical protein